MKSLLTFICVTVIGFTVNAQRVVSVGGGGSSSSSGVDAGSVISMITTNLTLFDVRSFGATAGMSYAGHTPNVASNTQAYIQAAIDAASTNGGQVYFPPGVYSLSTNFAYLTYLTEGLQSSLKIRSNNVFLVCDSPGSAVLTQAFWSGSGNNVIGSGDDGSGTGPTNVGIINLKICHASGSTSDTTQFQATWYTYFLGMIVEDSRQDAIDVQGGGPVFIDNFRSSNCAENSISAFNTEVHVSNFDVEGKGDFDIFTGCAFYAVNGIFRNNTNSVNANGDMCSLVNVVFKNPNTDATNIVCEGSLIVEDCRFSGATGGNGAAILIKTNTGFVRIQNNVFLDRGVVVLQGNQVSICNNNFHANQTGIRVHRTSDQLHVSGNRFTSTEGMRYFGSPTYRPIIEGNYFTVNYHADNAGTNHIIMNNIFSNAVLNFVSGDGERLQFLGNTILGTGVTNINFSGLNADSGAIIKNSIIGGFDFDNTAAVTFDGCIIGNITGDATGSGHSSYFNMPNNESTIISGSTSNAAALPATGSTLVFPLSSFFEDGSTTTTTRRFKLPYSIILTNIWVDDDTGIGANTNFTMRIYTNGTATHINRSVLGAGVGTPFTISNLIDSTFVAAGTYIHIGFSNNSASAPVTRKIRWQAEAIKTRQNR